MEYNALYFIEISLLYYRYTSIYQTYSAYLYILEATLGPELVFTIAEENSTLQFDYWVVNEH